MMGTQKNKWVNQTGELHIFYVVIMYVHQYYEKN